MTFKCPFIKSVWSCSQVSKYSVVDLSERTLQYSGHIYFVQNVILVARFNVVF
jgi:hypothetical protein